MTNLVVAHNGASFGGRTVCHSPASKQKSLHRRCNVGAAKRISRFLRGCPNARRAWGSSRTNYLPQAVCEHGLLSRCLQKRAQATPVFMIDRRGVKNDERLPRIWLSEPSFDTKTGQVAGRVFVDVYPHGFDRGGTHALALAERYLGEAYGYEINCAESASPVKSGEQQDSADLRTACFQAAEILCLHAVSRGNTQACVYLASLYRDDLCAGAYWKSSLELCAAHAQGVDYQMRAYGLLCFAASCKNSEACLLLGDALAKGVGCTANAVRAFAFYRSAFSLSCTCDDPIKDIDCVVPSTLDITDNLHAGQAAFRIACCYENGRGCVQNNVRALQWYCVAGECLQAALEAGYWRCKRSYFSAKKGVSRMKQEISGKY